MTIIDGFIANERFKKSNIKKADLDEFVTNSLEQILQINEFYKKFIEGAEDAPALLHQIEQKFVEIKNKYDEYFISQDQGGLNKIQQLDEKYQVIIEYHKTLLDGDDSIKADIEDSKKNITDFYNYLFTSEEDKDDNETRVKEAINEIVNFSNKINDGEDAYKKVIGRAYDAILNEYNELFEEDENGVTKVSKVEQAIDRITIFDTSVKKEIQPFIEDLKQEMQVKSNEVKALLNGASGGSLIEGYLNSKREYQTIPYYEKIEGNILQKIKRIFLNFAKFFQSLISVVWDYLLFILPLLLAVIIFVRPDLVAKITNSNGDLTDYFKNLDVLSRITISLPLWWISWFGQRSISHKRRLAEEYNHKAQVAKMYINFSSRETAGVYPIAKEARNRLDLGLIDVIERNPGYVYGDDETIIDKLIQAIKASKGIVDDVVEKGKSVINGEK